MYILIATYLAIGSIQPVHDNRLYSQSELKECREDAELYVKRARAGQAWAFCTKVREIKK